jgi:hypothetical protein
LRNEKTVVSLFFKSMPNLSDPLMRSLLAVLLSLTFANAVGQNIEAVGFFAGFNFPVTIDEGLQKDPRYFGRFTFRGTPIGFSYGYDQVGFGYLISPSYTQIGQKFAIKNSIGGEIGTRDVEMDYLSVPIALKLHINDLAFFRLSAVAAINFNYLLNGRETIAHSASKVIYPAGVSVPTGPGYSIAYDGVFIPAVSELEYVSKDKFNSFQLFAALGLRSDFDLNDHWSISFDGRANFGIFDSRQPTYLDQLKKPSGPADIHGNPGAPDLSGQRRETYIAINVGISRIIQSKAKFKTKQTGITNRGGSNAPKGRNKKPKG